MSVASTKDYLVNGCLLKCDNCYKAGQEGYDDYTVFFHKKNDVSMSANGQITLNNLDTSQSGNFIWKFNCCKAPDYFDRLGEIISMLQRKVALPPPQLSAEDLAYFVQKLGLYQPLYESLITTPKPIDPRLQPCFHEIFDTWYESDERFEMNHEYEAMRAVSDQFNFVIRVCDYICGLSMDAIEQMKNKKDLYKFEKNGIHKAQKIAKKLAPEVTKPFHVLEDQFNEQAYLYDQADELVKALGSIAAELENLKATTNYGRTIMVSLNVLINSAETADKVNFKAKIDNFRTAVHFSAVDSVGVMSEEQFFHVFGSYYNDALTDLIQKIGILKAKLISGETKSYELTDKSFLVCRFGGTITVFKTGQWMMEVANKILPNFRTMLRDIIANANTMRKNEAALYASNKEAMQSDWGTREYYEENPGVLSEISRGAEAVLELSYSESGVIPKEFDCPAYIRIHFYPQNYLDMNESKMETVLGAAMLAPVVFPESSAVAVVGSGITIMLFVNNFIEGELGFSDGVTVANSGLEAVDSAWEKNNPTNYRNSTAGGIMGEAGKFVSGLDTALGAVGLLGSIYSLVQGSDRYYLGQTEIELITPQASYSYKQDYDFLGFKKGALRSMRIDASFYDEQRFIDSMKSGFYIDDAELKEIYGDVALLGGFSSGETSGEAK